MIPLGAFGVGTGVGTGVAGLALEMAALPVLGCLCAWGLVSTSQECGR